MAGEALLKSDFTAIGGARARSIGTRDRSIRHRPQCGAWSHRRIVATPLHTGVQPPPRPADSAAMIRIYLPRSRPFASRNKGSATNSHPFNASVNKGSAIFIAGCLIKSLGTERRDGFVRCRRVSSWN